MRSLLTSPQTTALSAPALITLLTAIAGTNTLALFIHVPSLSTITAELETDLATTQLTVSLFLAATAFGQLFVGGLADRFGRRPVLFGGLFVFLVAALICTFATSIGMLIAGRLLLGLGGATGGVLGRAIIRDLYERDRAASLIGYVTMGFSMGPVVAPLIGGVFEEVLNWRWTFAFLVVYGVAIAFATWRFLPETRPTDADTGSFRALARGFAELATVPAYWGFVLIGGITSGVLFLYVGGVPIISSEFYGLDPVAFGFYFMIGNLGYPVGNYLTGRYAQRLGIFRTILVGGVLNLLLLASLLALTLTGTLETIGLFACMFVLTLAVGMAVTGSIAGAVSVRPKLAGAAAGVMGSVQIGSGAIGSWAAAALLAAFGVVSPLVMTMVTAGLIAFGISVWVRHARS